MASKDKINALVNDLAEISDSGLELDPTALALNDNANVPAPKARRSSKAKAEKPDVEALTMDLAGEVTAEEPRLFKTEDQINASYKALSTLFADIEAGKLNAEQAKAVYRLHRSNVAGRMASQHILGIRK
jgi:hypothetical protein